MSMLHLGSRCSACKTVDFLPFTCPSCSSIFCQSHIHTHACIQDAGPSSRPLGSLKTIGDGRCELKGCSRPTIEALGGKETSDVLSDGIAREVRCGICGGAYCTAHRQQAAHSYTGQRDYTVRQDAAADRKAKAADILSRTFPGRAASDIAKPTKKDDTRVRATSPERLPPSLKCPPPPSTDAEPLPRRAKTKDEKLYDMHLRKLKSLATPLDTSSKAMDDRRFFEYAVDLAGETLNGWRGSGKYGAQAQKVCIGSIPLGKVMDLIIARGKIKRSTSVDPAEALGLLMLSALPDRPRSIEKLDLSKSADSIPDGTIILLVKGPSHHLTVI